ncbi:ion-translocating oxidoreductase complex subunit C-like [Penaeus japonicus]|uniref:ion-translocating oxidoreductase complex subunit C-like n=1 Tax=Penaeus japonicus TaxID=27405 RepID=UPI001C71530C|nr:ion-translocating oxidoreductase complex subunit C-like [Penaeus japonicus]
MRLLVILAAVGASCAAPAIVTPISASSVVAAPSAAHVALPYVPPVTYVARHHAQDELGQANYGYSFPGQFQSEARDALGNVAGAYGYVDADGKTVVAQYTAGVDGFQIRANNLPVAASPELSLPEPVKDTPEVTAAKVQFVDLYNAAALAAAEAPDEAEGESVVAGLDDQGHLVVEARTDLGSHSKAVSAEAAVAAAEAAVAPALDLPKPVKDTPEVTDAKIKFMNMYNAAAIAAAAAPDDVAGDDDAAAGSAGLIPDTRQEAETEASVTESPVEVEEVVTELGSDTDQNTEAPEAATANESVQEISPVGESADGIAEVAEASEVNHNEIAEAAEVEGESVPADPHPADDDANAATEGLSLTPTAAASAQVLSPSLVFEATEDEVPPEQQDLVSLRTRQDAPVSGTASRRGPEADTAPKGTLTSQLVLSPGVTNPLGPWYVFGLARSAHGSLIPLLSQHPVAAAQGGASLTPLSFYHRPHGAYSHAFPYAPRFVQYVRH